jgi:hypothetical protein
MKSKPVRELGGLSPSFPRSQERLIVSFKARLYQLIVGLSAICKSWRSAIEIPPHGQFLEIMSQLGIRAWKNLP